MNRYEVMSAYRNVPLSAPGIIAEAFQRRDERILELEDQIRDLTNFWKCAKVTA